jgi:hypothetical protein
VKFDIAGATEAGHAVRPFPPTSPPRGTQSPFAFFRQIETTLRALGVPFDARDLLEYTDARFPLRDQERSPAAWAAAFLAEQAPAGPERRAVAV